MRSRSRQSNESTVDSSFSSPGIPNLALKNTQRGSTLWTLCRIAETCEESEEITWMSAEKHELRNDRGALPRGREVSKAHAWTRIHAIRHGRI